MTTTTKGKAPQRETAKAFQSNHFISFGGNENAFDVFHSTEKTDKTQCPKCSPPLVMPKGELKLCADCRDEEAHTATVLLSNFRRHRKVWVLDRRCVACFKHKTGAMMVKRENFCKSCFSKMTQTNDATRNRMIAGAVNNQHRRLREATSYVS